jgi:sulfur carrier protein
VNATINGERRTLADGITVEELLRDLAVPATGIAIAVNACVVRRSAFASRALAEGDAVEIIRAVAGG